METWNVIIKAFPKALKLRNLMGKTLRIPLAKFHSKYFGLLWVNDRLNT